MTYIPTNLEKKAEEFAKHHDIKAEILTQLVTLRSEMSVREFRVMMKDEFGNGAALLRTLVGQFTHEARVAEMFAKYA